MPKVRAKAVVAFTLATGYRLPATVGASIYLSRACVSLGESNPIEAARGDGRQKVVRERESEDSQPTYNT